MKKFISGAALILVFGAGVMDAEAITWAGRSTVKTPFGHNDKPTKTLFDRDYKNSTQAAEQAMKLVKQFIAALEGFKKKNPQYKAIVEACIKDWKKVDVALESIQHKRKFDDIIPDCIEAMDGPASATRLAQSTGKEQEILQMILQAGLARWPAPPTNWQNSPARSAERVIYDLYTAIRALSEIPDPQQEAAADAERQRQAEAAEADRKKQEQQAAEEERKRQEQEPKNRDDNKKQQLKQNAKDRFSNSRRKQPQNRQNCRNSNKLQQRHIKRNCKNSNRRNC